jgi:NAD(P)-dependent dehydrogenase (short-subunit alcohol dehydrogenase family)
LELTLQKFGSIVWSNHSSKRKVSHALELKNPAALITRATRGIGKATARELADVHVIVSGRNKAGWDSRRLSNGAAVAIRPLRQRAKRVLRRVFLYFQ